jgi:hypothetical protein
VGVSHAYMHALRAAGPAYVDKNTSFLVAHLLNVCPAHSLVQACTAASGGCSYPRGD